MVRRQLCRFLRLRWTLTARCPSLRFYGNNQDGDAFLNSIRSLFLSFNTLMDRPLDEGVKIKVASCSCLYSPVGSST